MSHALARTRPLPIGTGLVEIGLVKLSQPVSDECYTHRQIHTDGQTD